MIAIEIFEIHTQFFCTHDMNTSKYQTINTYRCSLLFHFRKCVNSCSFNLENDTINVFVELPILPLKSKDIRRGARGPPAPLDPLLNVERCDDRMSSLLLLFTSLAVVSTLEPMALSMVHNDERKPFLLSRLPRRAAIPRPRPPPGR